MALSVPLPAAYPAWSLQSWPTSKEAGEMVCGTPDSGRKGEPSFVRAIAKIRCRGSLSPGRDLADHLLL